MKSTMLAMAVFVLGAVFLSPALGKGKGGSETKVKVKIQATKPDGKGNQEISLMLTIEDGWHLYANPVDHDSLEPAKTTLKVTSKTKLANLKITYPPGKLKVDLENKDQYKVYEGKVTIRANVQRAADDTGPLDVILVVNACDKSQCLPKGTIKLKVP